MREARRTRRDPPQMMFRSSGRVAVGSGRAGRGGAEVWLVRYDPKEQTIEVKDGDNRGHTVVEISGQISSRPDYDAVAAAKHSYRNVAPLMAQAGVTRPPRPRA